MLVSEIRLTLTAHISIYGNELGTKLPQFGMGHLQMHFLKRNILPFDSYFT